eukprot:2504938-Rhodomonas_salina.1
MHLGACSVHTSAHDCVHDGVPQRTVVCTCAHARGCVLKEVHTRVQGHFVGATRGPPSAAQVRHLRGSAGSRHPHGPCPHQR